MLLKYFYIGKDKMMKRLKQNSFGLWMVISVIFAVLIHILFSIKAPVSWLEAKWSAGDILTYASGVSLGLLAMWQNQRFKEENDKSQERLEKLTIQANELNIIDKIIENETRKLQEAQTYWDDFCDACEYSTIHGIYLEFKDDRDALIRKLNEHMVLLQRLFTQLERIVHRDHTQIAQSCFTEICESTKRAEQLCCSFMESNIEKEDDELQMLKDYHQKALNLIQARIAFLSVQEGRINAILYKNLSLEEVRKLLNPSGK